MVQSQLREIVCETLAQKNPSQKRVGGVTQDIGLSSNPIPERKKKSWALVAHACNSSYSGDRDQDSSSKPTLGQ
jgi:hypothetical protein